MSRITTFAACLSLAVLSSPSLAVAADANSCSAVRFADVGWTDIQATTATASVLFEALGYQPEANVLSVPVTLASLKAKDVDVFLGNWMPTMSMVQPYLDEGSIERVSTNLEGAGYGLVVPRYVADAGVKTLSDLGKFKDKFRGNIYGIEPGNDGHRIILEMIATPSNNLEGFELVESSEAGMLSQVEKAARNGEWIAFLGWTPHPVMGAMNLYYLEGMGDSGFGSATVYTLVRSGYPAECPNAARLVSNLKFNLEMEGAIMDAILKGTEAETAAADWLKKNPDAITPWLEGVTTLDGSDAQAAVKAALQ